MHTLTVKDVRIDDTFAEAFGMRATAVIITADSLRWARQAALTMTGFATSVIGCGCEAGIDGELTVTQTPDRRPGVRDASSRKSSMPFLGRQAPRFITASPFLVDGGISGAYVTPL